jgi:glutamate-1-semialdehyde 2,1-aminomutase
MSEFPKSKQWYERARKSLAGGVSSQFRAGSPHPMFYERGEGAYIWDVDGNRLLDFTLSQGPLILGHSHQEVLDSMQRAMRRGQLFAGQHEEEVELAETLQRLIPSAQRVRFSSTGSEADHAAMRLARFVTGRRKIVKFEGQYHGWFDNISWNVNPKPDEMGPREKPNAVAWGGGIPQEGAEDLVILPWNDLAAVEAVFEREGGEVAAIITEPVMCNQGCIEPGPGFLEGLREICDRYDAALIFDEIITGFRIDLGGAQSYYGVTPDLSVFGKALASGMPLSALVARERFLAPVEQNAVYHAGTMNSNNLCIAAAAATLKVLERDDRAAHKRIVRLGSRLRDGLAELGARHGLPLKVQGPGPMFHAGFSARDEVRDYRDTLAYDTAGYARFSKGMLARGVRLIGRGLWYISAAHTDEHVETTLTTADAVLAEMKVGA